MASKGWWSGDFHLHRPPEDAKTLLMAEDLNLGVFFTMWNKGISGRAKSCQQTQPCERTRRTSPP